MAFTSLNHYMDYNWLLQAYQMTRKDGATGVDGQTAEMYERQLEPNLLNLLDRIKSGRYRAPVVRRAYIEKGNGQKRPLGIPTFEDKIVQRAVVMLLERIYEQDFYHCSFGFKGRVARTLKSFNDYCRKLRGHYAYFGIMGNAKSLDTIQHKVKEIWHKWFCRRSQKSYITWEKFNLFLSCFPLAPPKIHHRYSYSCRLVNQ